MLCDLFNSETNNGVKMENYTELLKSAIKEIKHLFTKKNIQSLTSRRDGILLPDPDMSSETNKYELITWLILL